MGVTAGCYDEYSSSLGCQWIDVTKIMQTAANLNKQYCLCVEANVNKGYG